MPTRKDLTSTQAGFFEITPNTPGLLTNPVWKLFGQTAHTELFRESPLSFGAVWDFEKFRHNVFHTGEFGFIRLGDREWYRLLGGTKLF